MNPHWRPWVAVAGLNGLMAVAMAALASHGIADTHAQALAERGWQLQFLHALALLAADRLAAEGRRPASLAAALFTFGILLFSGSLYWKALLGPVPLPLVTPAGGISFMLGWLALALASRR